MFWEVHLEKCFQYAPSQCKWDCWRAPSNGQIQGARSRTQPGCCSQLMPSPNSNWCHCSRDKKPPRKTKYRCMDTKQTEILGPTTGEDLCSFTFTFTTRCLSAKLNPCLIKWTVKITYTSASFIQLNWKLTVKSVVKSFIFTVSWRL